MPDALTPGMSAAALVRGYRSGALSPVEVADHALELARAVQPRLNAFITFLDEDARTAARASEQRYRREQPLGPFDGVPVAMKDLVHMAGVRTTAASKVLADYIATEDAEVVRRLRAGGAVILGKTNLHEFAYGPTGVLSSFGSCRNPRDVGRMAGGSSSGSAAAVAAGVCPVAVGSDTGGSIRIPAALCGVVGLKPTYGRVSTSGVLPLSWSLDHVGPITATVEDAGLALAAMSDFTWPSPGPLDRPLRVGVCRDHFFEHLDAAVRECVERGIRLLGEPREVRMPSIRLSAAAQSLILASEARAFHQRWLAERGDDYEPGVRNRLEAALEVRGVDYVQAARLRRVMVDEMRAALEGVDVLAMPAVPVPAPPLSATDVAVEDGSINVLSALLQNTSPVNFTGFPAISVPCGETDSGLPVGLQLVARPWQEAHLLAASWRLEQLLGASRMNGIPGRRGQ